MIECIFTIDYEIYGNGEGSLKDLVYEPTERLIPIFRKWDARFVAFVEAAELETIERHHTDDALVDVQRQIGELHRQGFEIGLHLHPQWYNGRYVNGSWHLDYTEYNLCTLERPRIEEIVRRSISYLRKTIGKPDFTPISFRAGNWLLQPSGTIASVLEQEGIRVESSVFKGGLQRGLGLDYRPALRNGNYWRFRDDINTADPSGRLIEIPTYTRMVPSWKMITAKRMGLQKKSASKGKSRGKLNSLLDRMRFCYPLKFDFCRMTMNELTRMMDGIIREDRKAPDSFFPVVAIGHTKDLTDFNTVQSFLSYLDQNGIAVSTFIDVYTRCS